MKKARFSEINIGGLLENLYLVAFAVFLAQAFLWTTTFQIEWPTYFYNNVRAVMVIFIFSRVAYSQNYTVKEIAFTGILSLMFLLIWRRNGQEVILNTLIFILGSRGIPGKKIMKVFVAVTGILLLITITASSVGIIENLIYYQGTRRARVSFGIVYPTDFSAHVFYTILAYCYLRKEKIKYIEIVGIGIIGIAVYYFCDARVNTVCILGTAAVFLYNKFMHSSLKRYKMNSVWSMLLALSTVICALFMTVMSIIYSSENKFCVFLDQLINNRLRMGKKGIDLFGFSLFGQNIPMQGNGSTTKEVLHYFYLDCSYISIAMQYGIIILGLILIIWSLIAFRARRENDWVLLWVIALVSVQCMIEHHMLDLSYNPFLWLLLADTMSKSVEKQKLYRLERWKVERWEGLKKF